MNYNETNTPETVRAHNFNVCSHIHPTSISQWNPHTADVAHLYAGISRFTCKSPLLSALKDSHVLTFFASDHIKIFTPGDHMVISQWYLEVVSLLEGHLKTPHDNRRISKDVVAKEIDSIGYDYYTKILKYSQTNPNPDGHVLGYCWVM